MKFVKILRTSELYVIEFLKNTITVRNQNVYNFICVIINYAEDNYRDNRKSRPINYQLDAVRYRDVFKYSVRARKEGFADKMDEKFRVSFVT